MSRRDFTGERLHTADELFSVDLARHRAAYEFARTRGDDGWLLDLGSGSGHGAAELATSRPRVAAVDRIAPDPNLRDCGAAFVVGDLRSLPLASGAFLRVLSFQVIEHFDDPGVYLDALESAVHPEGEVILTTPNRLTSDGVNPYHLREYTAAELEALLTTRFSEVEIRGTGASPPVRAWFDGRNRRVAAILRLDPLRLRERLPKAVVHFLFAKLAVLVRWLGRRTGGLPDVTWRDFPIGPPADDCLDLLAVCRRPRAARSPAAEA